MGVGGGHDVGPGGVDLGVDGEGGAVDRPVALDDLALVVEQHQVADPDVGEGLAERVDPEVVGQLRVAGGDVPGDALLVAEVGEEPEGGGQALLAVEALLLHGLEDGRVGKAELGHSPEFRPDGPGGQQSRRSPWPTRTSPWPSNRDQGPEKTVLPAQPPMRASRSSCHNARTTGSSTAGHYGSGRCTEKGRATTMFDLIPRWALALGIGTVSAAGVVHPRHGHPELRQAGLCVPSSAVIESSACADTSRALAGIDQLKAQLTGTLGGAQSQVQGIVANAKSQVASASTAAQSTLGSTMATVTGKAEVTGAFTTASDTIGKVFSDVSNALDLAQVNADSAFAIAGTALDVAEPGPRPGTGDGRLGEGVGRRRRGRRPADRERGRRPGPGARSTRRWRRCRARSTAPCRRPPARATPTWPGCSAPPSPRWPACSRPSPGPCPR